MSYRSGAHDGSEPERRYYPVVAKSVRHGYAVCALSAVRHPRLRAAVYRWSALLAAGRIALLGHNAIIRVQPFIEHCALAPLPGEGSFAGSILSHDFVEAALMRRAGWGVWIAYDLPGSYEELPPNLLDELKRDRRWCHGNLMNFRLFLVKACTRCTARCS